MKKPTHTVSVLAIFATFLVSTQAVATSCHPQNLADHIRLAEWVFIGTAAKAVQIDSDLGSIAFTLTDIDRVRGNPPDQVELTTGQFAYNPRIVIGDRYIVFTNPGESYVNICTGFANSDGIEVWTTFLLPKFGDCGRSEDRQSALFHARAELLKQDRTFTSHMISEMLDGFRQQNPELRVSRKEEQIVVKGFQFIFNEDSLVGLELVNCDGLQLAAAAAFGR